MLKSGTIVPSGIIPEFWVNILLCQYPQSHVRQLVITRVVEQEPKQFWMEPEPKMFRW